MNRPTSTPKSADCHLPQSATASPIDSSTRDSGFSTHFASPQSLQHAFNSPDDSLAENTLDSTVTFNPKRIPQSKMSDVEDLAAQIKDMTANFTALQTHLQTENKALSDRLVSESNALRQSIDRLQRERDQAADELNVTKQKCQDLEAKLNNQSVTNNDSFRRDDRGYTKRGPQVTLPTFDGSVYSSFEKWRRQLEIHFDYLEWQKEDPQRAAVIPTLLTDFAFVQYNTLNSVTRKNYESTMAALNAVFAIDKKPLSFRRNYINRKQKYNESVRDFSADIMQRFAECNPPLETQVDVYTNMLNPLIAAEIQDEEYTDLKSLVACAEKAEHRLRLRREASQSVNHISFDRQGRRDQSRGRSRDRRSHSRQGYNNRFNRSRSDGNEITAAIARAASRSLSRNRSQSRFRSENRYDGGYRLRQNSNPREPRDNHNRGDNSRHNSHSRPRDSQSRGDNSRHNSRGRPSNNQARNTDPRHNSYSRRHSRDERRNSVNNVHDLN